MGDITIGNTGLPEGMDVERVEFDVERLRRGVIGWGGYETLSLGAYRGDADTYNVGIESDGNGAGYGTMTASVTKAETSRSSQQSDRHLNNLNIRNGDLKIEWNSSALNSRIETADQYSPRVRARQLNKLIRHEGSRAVVRHNTKEILEDRSKANTIINAGLDMYASGFVVSFGSWERATIAVAGYSVVRSAATLFLTRRQVLDLGHPANDALIDPLLCSTRATRAAFGVGVLATGKLVRGR